MAFFCLENESMIGRTEGINVKRAKWRNDDNVDDDDDGDDVADADANEDTHFDVGGGTLKWVEKWNYGCTSLKLILLCLIYLSRSLIVTCP